MVELSNFVDSMYIEEHICDHMCIEDYCLLRCDTVLSGSSLPSFWRNVIPASSGQNSKPSYKYLHCSLYSYCFNQGYCPSCPSSHVHTTIFHAQFLIYSEDGGCTFI
jgi:hypothetical protein